MIACMFTFVNVGNTCLLSTVVPSGGAPNRPLPPTPDEEESGDRTLVMRRVCSHIRLHTTSICKQGFGGWLPPLTGYGQIIFHIYCFVVI